MTKDYVTGLAIQVFGWIVLGFAVPFPSLLTWQFWVLVLAVIIIHMGLDFENAIKRLDEDR